MCKHRAWQVEPIEKRDGPGAGMQENSRPFVLAKSGFKPMPARFGMIRRRGWILVACFLFQCTRPVQVGQKAPEFVLESLSGRPVSLGELRGRIVFLHFWATWCPPCLVELPGLHRFVEKLDTKKYSFLAVCVDSERPGRIKDFLGSWGADLPVYLDPGGVLARKYGTTRFPETYVLDQAGVVCRKVVGAGDWRISKWAQILHNCAQEDATEDATHSDALTQLLSHVLCPYDFCSGFSAFYRKRGKEDPSGSHWPDTPLVAVGGFIQTQLPQSRKGVRK
jgi:thiol-disulfide isomerase/thioredoxin